MSNNTSDKTPRIDAGDRILVVDDHKAIREGLRTVLASSGYTNVDDAADAETALQRVLVQPPDLLIVDLNLPGRSGLDLVGDLQERGIDTTIVMLTGHGTIEGAVEATRRGIFEYLTKPADPKRLCNAVERGLERTALRRELLSLRRELVRSGRLGEMVGRSPAMLELYRMIEQIAPSPASVLITGESGTGKEVVARTLHRLSNRSARPLVAINCAAIPGALLESELFGHEKGAFTGATAARAGCFEQAHGGTLFLDEIGDMPADLQTKLLRALEDGKVRRVGGDREIEVDARVVSATNADLEAQLRDGKFRKELFYRLNVFLLVIPPLRERVEDIAVLAEHFLVEFRQSSGARLVDLSEAARQKLASYAWPGNVRELRNAIQRAAILCGEDDVQVEHLPPALRGGESFVRASNAGTFNGGTSLAEVER
ncbi:MAG: sigma-54 dependent transcriptional regulator [Candidatus Eisenbacteria bacterium]